MSSLARYFAPDLDVFRGSQPAWGLLDHRLFQKESAAGLVFPRLDYITTDNAIKINVEVPGVDKKDLDISLNG